MRVLFLIALSICVLGTTVAAQAATAVSLSPTDGHPSTVVSLSGTGFGASEAVDVYVDAVDTLVLFSSSTGTISGSVTIPVTATPGAQYITAVGRRTGDGAQTSFDVTTKWQQFGYGPGHLSTNPWENVLNINNVSAIGPTWINNPLGNMGASGATVAVDNGYAYVSTEMGIEALSTSTGNVLWSYAAAGTVYASPTVSGGVVYIGSGSNQAFYALNATTGAVIWSTSLPGFIYSSAAIANGIVYVGCTDDNVYALNASTGAIVWAYTTGEIIAATPTVVDGVVYIGSYDSNVYALNATTGARLWQYTTGGSVESTAAVANGVVFVGSSDDNVYAIEAQGQFSGTLLWKYTTGGPVYSSPAVANDTVYVGSQDDNLYALSAVNGVPLWSYPTGSTVNSAVVANGVVYFTTGAGIFCAFESADSGVLASGATGGTYLGSPSISDGVVYVAPEGGNIYAFALPPNLSNNTPQLKAPPRPASLHPDLRLPISH